jgi:lipopolysaccharide export system permease protein
MIFTTLGRHFFKLYVTTFLWFALGTSAIIFLADFSETTRRLSYMSSYSLLGASAMTLLRLPLILQQTIPFLALFVGMTVLIALNRKYELVVTRAAGISAWQFMQPFIFGALAMGLATTFLLNPLAAFGMRQSQTLETDWRMDAGRLKEKFVIPWFRQTVGTDDMIIGAASVSDDGTTLNKATVFHFDADGRIVLRQDAATAKLEDGYWLLNQVSELRPGEIVKTLPEVKVRTNLEQKYLTERLTAPEDVGFFELSRKIDAAKSYGVPPYPLQTQYHYLLSLPVLLVAMTLIAATVSLKFSRFAQSRSMILGGIISGFVLYVVTALVKAFGSSGILPPFVAAWIPVIVALAAGATVLLHQEDG